jgi:hypothetical protein
MEFRIPMYDIGNWRFQVNVQSLRAIGTTYTRTRFFAVPIKGCDCDFPEGFDPYYGPLVGTIITDELKEGYDVEVSEDGIPEGSDAVLWFQQYSTEDEAETTIDWDVWNAGVGDLHVINPGDCFRLHIVQVYYIETEEGLFFEDMDHLGCTNCFCRPLDDCFISNIRYGCNENTEDFFYNYQVGETNVLKRNYAELEFYLKNPQTLSDESSYKKSAGSIIKLHHVIDEEYSLETDWWPYEWHRDLEVALSSDYLQIINRNINQQAFPLISTLFTCKEKYSVDWPETHSLLAKGSTKLLNARSLNLKNSNCK